MGESGRRRQRGAGREAASAAMGGAADRPLEVECGEAAAATIRSAIVVVLCASVKLELGEPQAAVRSRSSNQRCGTVQSAAPCNWIRPD